MTGVKGRARLGAGAAELLLGRSLLLGAPLFQRLLRLLLGALLGLRRTFHTAQPTASGGRALGLGRGPVEDDRGCASLQRVVAAAAAGERHLEAERLLRVLVEAAEPNRLQRGHGAREESGTIAASRCDDPQVRGEP